MGVVVRDHRPQHGDSVGERCGEGHQLADRQAGRSRSDRAESAANFRWSFWLGIPRLVLRRSAAQEDDDHRLGFAERPFSSNRNLRGLWRSSREGRQRERAETCPPPSAAIRDEKVSLAGLLPHRRSATFRAHTAATIGRVDFSPRVKMFRLDQSPPGQKAQTNSGTGIQWLTRIDPFTDVYV